MGPALTRVSVAAAPARASAIGHEDTGGNSGRDPSARYLSDGWKGKVGFRIRRHRREFRESSKQQMERNGQLQDMETLVGITGKLQATDGVERSTSGHGDTGGNSGRAPSAR
jgi:hypothetical protein